MTLESLMNYVIATPTYQSCSDSHRLHMRLGVMLAHEQFQRVLKVEKEHTLAALVEIDNKNDKLHKQIETIQRETEERVHREHLESHEFMSQAVERLEAENRQLKAELVSIAAALKSLAKYTVTQ